MIFSFLFYRIFKKANQDYNFFIFLADIHLRGLIMIKIVTEKELLEFFNFGLKVVIMSENSQNYQQYQQQLAKILLNGALTPDEESKFHSENDSHDLKVLRGGLGYLYFKSQLTPSLNEKHELLKSLATSSIFRASFVDRYKKSFDEGYYLNMIKYSSEQMAEVSFNKDFYQFLNKNTREVLEKFKILSDLYKLKSNSIKGISTSSEKLATCIKIYDALDNNKAMLVEKNLPLVFN